MSSDAAREELEQAPDRLADRRIAVVTAVSIVITTVALVVAWALFETWTPEQRRGAGAPAPAPQTISTVEQSLILYTERGLELRRQQAASLAEWGWVDRDAGIARIPVEKAIDLLAAAPLSSDRGIDGRDLEDGGSEAQP